MGIFDDLKSAATILKEAGKVEQYRQILEAQEKLLEMQNKISELEGENRTLKEKLKTKEELKYEGNAYWRMEGDRRDGPFCSRCWDKNKDLIRINQSTYVCPECQTGPYGMKRKPT